MPVFVQISELDSQDGEDFIVMEYVPGQTLAQLLRTKRLSIDEALDYSRQIPVLLMLHLEPTFRLYWQLFRPLGPALARY